MPPVLKATGYILTYPSPRNSRRTIGNMFIRLFARKIDSLTYSFEPRQHTIRTANASLTACTRFMW